MDKKRKQLPDSTKAIVDTRTLDQHLAELVTNRDIALALTRVLKSGTDASVLRVAELLIARSEGGTLLPQRVEIIEQ